MNTYALILGLSFLLSVLMTPKVTAIAHRLGWLDYPGRRKTHQIPTPRLGGVPIYLAFVVSLLPLLVIDNRLTTLLKIHWPVLEFLPFAITTIFLLGLMDDVVGVSIPIKLLVQIACSLWVFFHGINIEYLTNPFGGRFDVGIWSLPLTVLWLVGLTNAFNLIDGMDGLAGGVALFGMTTLIIVSVITGSPLLIVPLIALAGAVAGFLPYNFHPARIFLGDSGSLFLGFTLASLSLIWVQKSTLAVAILGPILLFALPIADTFLAIIRRFVSGFPILSGDKDHIHHRLLSRGWSPHRVVSILYASCFLFGLMTLVLVQMQSSIALFVILSLALVCWVAFSYLGYPEMAEINITIRRALLEQREIFSQRVQLRKLIDSITNARDIPELWAHLISLAKTFEFDHVSLVLQAPEGFGPLASSRSFRHEDFQQEYWADQTQNELEKHPEMFWKIEIPIGTGEQSFAQVVFLRSFSHPSMHLRLDSLVSELSEGLTHALEAIRTAEGSKIAVRDRSVVSPQAPPGNHPS